MEIDPTTTKYMIHATITAEGIIKKPDVVGAIFGQTEGLLGDELDLRDLQRSNRMGRIEVEVKSVNGKTEGKITMPSSLDKVETAILAASLETIERIGPCVAKIKVEKIEDVRLSKRKAIVERAKELLKDISSKSSSLGGDLTDSVRQAVQVEEIISWGKNGLPAGPNIDNSDAIIIVEGRSDVLNLLKYGIKNTIAVEGTNIPDDVKELTKERIVTAFVDGDRGGDLIIAELLQTAEVDFIAKAPSNTEVEELTQKQIMKCLRNKIPTEQYIEMFDLDVNVKKDGASQDSNTHQRKKESKKRKDFHGSGKNVKKRMKNEKKITKQVGDVTKMKGRELQQKEEPVLSDKIKKIAGSIDELKKEGVGYFFNSEDEAVKEVKVGNMINELAKMEKGRVKSIVFGGVITQRLVDTAVEKGVKKIIGFRTYKLTKVPTQIQVIAKRDDK
ncbi:MAG TPA: DNA primase [Thermoplasmata archaeon]|nr:DNA primase [Thermoplasmata archaeon]